MPEINTPPEPVLNSPVNNPAPEGPKPLATLGDLDRQLDDSLRAVFDQNEPEIKHEPKENEKVEPHHEQERDQLPEPKKEVARPESSGNLIDPQTVADPKNLGKSSDGWKNLKSIASKNFEIANHRAKENEDIKKGFAQKETQYKTELEGLKKQVEELSGYRATVDIQADPEFISKYEQPIEKLQSELKSMLKTKSVSEEIISQIDFMNSEAMANIIDVLNNPEINKDSVFSKRFSRRVEDLAELGDKRLEHLDSWKKNSKEFIENKKKEAFTKQSQSEGRMLQLVDEISGMKDEQGNPKIAFLSRQEVPAGANQDQIKRIGAHNQVVDQMNSQLKQILKADSPEDRVEIAVAALGSKWLRWQLDSTTKQLKAKEDELSRIVKSGNEGDSRANNNPVKTSRPTASDPKTLDLDASLNAAFPGMR